MLKIQGFFSTLFLYRTQVKYMIPLKLLEAALLATNDGVVITESGGGRKIGQSFTSIPLLRH